MKMWHGLPAIFPTIGHKTKSGLVKSLFGGNGLYGLENRRKKSGMFIPDIQNGTHMFPGNNEDVHRSGRMGVRKRNDLIVFIHPGGRNGSFGDGAKNAFAHALHSQSFNFGIRTRISSGGRILFSNTSPKAADAGALNGNSIDPVGRCGGPIEPGTDIMRREPRPD